MFAFIVVINGYTNTIPRSSAKRQVTIHMSIGYFLRQKVIRIEHIRVAKVFIGTMHVDTAHQKLNASRNNMAACRNIQLVDFQFYLTY